VARGQNEFMKASRSTFDHDRFAIAEVRTTLAENGYALLPAVTDVEQAAAVLGEFGHLVPQYDGGLTHEVTYRPGNDDRAYSQSANTIRAHTEAPGWRPSPAYLALFCRRQARCGGGHTDLLDIEQVMPWLSPAEQSLMTDQEIDFPGPAHANQGQTVRTRLLSVGDDGRRVLRFSWNLLSTGEYDPPLNATPRAEDLPLGAAGGALADRVSALFAARATSVLIPENAVLIWDNRRMLHARSAYQDPARHLTRFWLNDRDEP
jgi:hypothetical protein